MARNGSYYLDTSNRPKTTIKTKKHRFIFITCLLMAMGIFASTISFVANPNISSTVAFADDDKGEAVLKKAKANSKYAEGSQGFDRAMKDLKGFDAKSHKGFLYALKRHFTIGYMNDGHDAYVAGEAGWYKDIFERRGKFNCGKGSGEQSVPFPGEKENNLLWHNCDVPNLITEFFQDVAILFLEPGFTGAAPESSYTNSNWFGFASTTPDNIKQNGNTEVTALEVFGYNLKLTSYRGEWDHIKVLTAARALSNFGFMDRFKLGAQALINGVFEGTKAAFNSLLDDFKSGNIVRLITSPGRTIKAFFSKGAAATVNTVIDSSDTNVFATYSWYRPEFGETLYNARQLSQEEISDYILSQLAKFFKQINPPIKAKAPAKLLAVSPKKLRAIPLPTPGECTGTWRGNREDTHTNDDGEKVKTTTVVSGNSKTTPYKKGKSACSKTIKNSAPSNLTGVTTSITKHQAQRTVGDWSSDAGWAGPKKEYQIFCNIKDGNSSSTDAGIVNKFLNCWNDDEFGWPAAEARETKNEQVRNNDTWYTEKLKTDLIAKYFRAQAAFFASPAAKYICTNPDGTDMKKGDGFVYLYLGKKGSMRSNPACGPTRSPIQNGFFGNGYLDNQPPVDTRREAFTPSPWSILNMDNRLGDLGLTVSKFTTRISNTVLNLTYSPVFAEIAGPMSATLISNFRDSLFFPLCALIVAMGALSIFFQAGMRRDFGAQFKSILLMAGVFIMGSFIMANPAKTIAIMDGIPSTVETLIIGAIYDVGGNTQDNLCKASTGGGSTVGTTGYTGEVVNFDPAASSRTIICQNWRVFAFTPYVYAQWGTAYQDLDASQMNLSPKVAELIGKPTVHLGPTVENNWALYQLDLITSGTTTNYEPQYSRSIDSNLYRVADMQAGPDYGKGTDARYFNVWSGNQFALRTMAALLGAIVSTVGMITICVFGFAKIQISILSMIMLLFMPIMFLIGLYPGKGRLQLKKYFLQLLSLMVQRIVLITMIALMFKIIIAISGNTTSFFYWAILTLAICSAFLIYRREIIDLFDKTITNGEKFMADGALMSAVPRTIRQKSQLARGVAKEGAIGALGGFTVGGVSGGIAGMKAAQSRSRALFTTSQGREGYGALSTALRAKAVADEDIDKRTKGYVTDKLNPLALTTARAKLDAELGEGNFTDDDVKRRAAEELANMGPQNKNQKKTFTRANRLEKSLNKDNDARSDEDILREIQETQAAAIEGEDSFFDSIKDENEQARVEAKNKGVKPKRAAELDALNEIMAEDLEANYRKKGLRDDTKDNIKETLGTTVPDRLTATAVSDYQTIRGEKERAEASIETVLQDERERSLDHAEARASIREDAMGLANEFLKSNTEKLRKDLSPEKLEEIRKAAKKAAENSSEVEKGVAKAKKGQQAEINKKMKEAKEKVKTKQANVDEGRAALDKKVEAVAIRKEKIQALLIELQEKTKGNNPNGRSIEDISAEIDELRKGKK